MTPLSRRRFLELGALGVGSALTASRLLAQASTPISTDVWIRNGTVIDPASGVYARRDVFIRDGRVLVVGAPGAVALRAPRVIDAAGLLVMPGLVDLHAHVGTADTSLGLPVDTLMERTGAEEGVNPDCLTFWTEPADGSAIRGRLCSL